MFINFLQEQHGNPFRRVGLSALLDAVDKSPNANRSVSEEKSTKTLGFKFSTFLIIVHQKTLQNYYFFGVFASTS